jgi:hypothetical protein
MADSRDITGKNRKFTGTGGIITKRYRSSKSEY